MNRRRAVRDIVISVVIGILVFMFMVQNREAVEVDFFIGAISAEVGACIVAAIILGLLLGFTNRSTPLSARGKTTDSGIRYESKSKLLGLPLLCIASGPNPEKNEDRGLAKGIIAIGDVSFGVLSFGGLAFGVVSVGGASVGLFSVGGLAIGVLALGGAAVGLLAAVGGAAIGYNVVGEVGIGIHHVEGAKIHILDLLTVE